MRRQVRHCQPPRRPSSGRATVAQGRARRRHGPTQPDRRRLPALLHLGALAAGDPAAGGRLRPRRAQAPPSCPSPGRHSAACTSCRPCCRPRARSRARCSRCPRRRPPARSPSRTPCPGRSSGIDRRRRRRRPRCPSSPGTHTCRRTRCQTLGGKCPDSVGRSPRGGPDTACSGIDRSSTDESAGIAARHADTRRAWPCPPSVRGRQPGHQGGWKRVAAAQRDGTAIGEGHERGGQSDLRPLEAPERERRRAMC